MSLIEYPGKISAIAFVGNCNLKCHFCYNIDLVRDYDKMPDIPEKDVLDFLSTRKNLLDSLAITGGEPTLYKELPGFMKKVKDLGFLVLLETNGTNPEMLKELITNKLVDYISMDIKAPIEKYDDIAGVIVNKENIQESINTIRNSGLNYEFRTTIIPRHFKEEDAIKIGEWLKGSKRYVLQQFRPEKTLNEDYKKAEYYGPEKLEELANLMRPFFDSVRVRGV